MTVTWGLLLQFGMGIVILRWPQGYAACKFLGDSVSKFLSYTDEGSKFVFGDPGFSLHPVAFGVSFKKESTFVVEFVIFLRM